MSLHAFKSLRDRRHEPWAPEDAERFGGLAAFLNDKHIAAVMRCAQPGCTDRTLKPVQQAGVVVLRCGCTDRALVTTEAARA